MKKLNSFVGWTLMLAVLAVPSFLFYNWWAEGSAGKAAAETVTGKTDLNVFPVQPVSTRAVTAQPAVPAAAGPAAQDPLPRSTIPAAAPLPAVAAEPPGPVSSAAAQTAKVVISTQTSYYNPKVPRDPTMSPEDYERIKEAEDQAREQALEEERRRLASKIVRKPKPENIVNKLRLQGIVGNAVIINGEMYSVGQSVYGAKILKVGADYMTGEYKGKKFRLVMP